MGRGLPTLGLAAGEEATEAQLRSLFGEGRHRTPTGSRPTGWQQGRRLQPRAGPGRSAPAG
ncbi:hypothetical protein T261_8578 [Streptomyces lydicus]|nr:hypothetical protein T261_8578 [Streptomyces lydicus]